jgi:hypothetical protein
MQKSQFEELCRDASLELGLQDTASLGNGFMVEHGHVHFEAAFRDGEDRFVLLAELGSVADEHKQHVYEQLLTLQLLTWTQPHVRFGFHPRRRTVMLGVGASLEAASGAWLAGMIRSTAAQAARWRETLLAGRRAGMELGDAVEAALGDSREAAT